MNWPIHFSWTLRTNSKWPKIVRRWRLFVLTISKICLCLKSRLVFLQFLFYLVQSGRFDKIVHRFPEPGHSFMPCDRAFGLVEKNLRKNDRIYIPTDYWRIITCTSKKFQVVPVFQNEIFKWVDHLKQFFPAAPKIYNTSGRDKKFLITKHRIFIHDLEEVANGRIRAGEKGNLLECECATILMNFIGNGINVD